MDKAMSDPYVAFIREAMAAKGCFAGRDFFKCVDCNNPAVGAAFIYPSSQDSNSSSSQNDNGKFLRHGGDQGVPTHVKDLDLATPQIVMCCDSKLLDFPFEFTRTVSHELIHAFDFCRAKLDVNKLEQHACTEIRASALSQECSISMELLRSNFNLRKQYQVISCPLISTNDISKPFFLHVGVCEAPGDLICATKPCM